MPGIHEVQGEIERGPSLRKLGFDSKNLDFWDSGFVSFLIRVIRICGERDIEVTGEGLPEGAQRLIGLALAVPERREPGKDEKITPSLVLVTGGRVMKIWASLMETLTFVGETATAFLRLFGGKARFKGSDFLLVVQESGAGALPIVSLISLLVGLILAFVGSIQLRMFGAQIYIADLVAIAMARAMGAIMTGIIMAGRTGAAFAARIGTMQVNEEIDALKTAGIPPMEFLVLPRILALALMMPLLTLYADLMGILGGMIVGVGGFGIGLVEYFNETRKALTLANIWIGLFSSLIFGVLIAVAGCLRGMRCGRSASAVGDTTTSAVVTSIVSIIIATALITIGCDVLGI
ncbi:MAG: putative phospholipid ABC transporter permease protein MlaE [Syntrophorhabdus sp. PtaU1.Bin153]|nr:MAG: putative phospholipid ABC transporter permease protein MlaE [Syntrophorhabdus sp. PtaU1.Bin153]